MVKDSTRAAQEIFRDLLPKVPVAALALLLALVVGGPCEAAEALPVAKPEITLYAAASLREVLADLAKACGREAGAILVLNLGSSSDLARQIEAAGKADMFISADEALMDRLDSAKLLEPGSRRSMVGNQLVVIAPADAAAPEVGNVKDLLLSAKHLSLANPEAVPAGKYARAWLEKLGVWEEVKDKVVPGVDVRAALAAVESGAVELGIVYRTDAFITKKVNVVHEVPRGEGPSISYPIAILKGRPNVAISRKVLACLDGPVGKMVFETRGFIWLSPAP
ncbi:MAG TPA: molybdate ABC transporter substrate-binding protein [Candidatus Polarisedimenticolia bacterium]|nr:molybdate ABC transporter substrate-binding protein [Candidatus Polarisedimenticolia bacterium]